MTRLMTPEQAAYFAGLFDGEGSVSIRRCGRTEVSFTLTSSPALRQLADIFGVAVQTDRRQLDNRKMTYRVRLYAGNALLFVSQIMPHSRDKFDQLALLVQFFKDKEAGKLDRRSRDFYYRTMRELHRNIRWVDKEVA